jgi:hypothetical protein
MAAAAVVYWGAQEPSTPKTDIGSGVGTIAAPRALTTVPLLSEFREVWGKRLQGAAPAAPPARDNRGDEPHNRVTNSSRVRLIGTILEAGHSVAVFLGPAGEVDIKSVGDDLEIAPTGMRVEEIRLASVTLSYRGKSLTLELPSNEVP